jgi:hypothetical protein
VEICAGKSGAIVARKMIRARFGRRLIEFAVAPSLPLSNCVVANVRQLIERQKVMAAKAKKVVRREYTKDDLRELRAHSKARTPIAKIVKQMKRTEGSLRQKALTLGIPLGHTRRAMAVRSGRRTGRKTR